MTEMVSQVTDEERNVVWLMRNNIPLIEERLEEKCASATEDHKGL